MYSVRTCPRDNAVRTAQVSGEAVLRGLKAVLGAAADVEAARPALEGYALTVRLAGVLGLDALSEACVDGAAPAPPLFAAHYMPPLGRLDARRARPPRATHSVAARRGGCCAECVPSDECWQVGSRGDWRGRPAFRDFLTTARRRLELLS